MFNHNPLVSIIVTTYNRSDFLLETVHSILQQTYLNFELLIIDDNSTDHTKKVISLIDDERIKYYCLSECSGGPAKPRNFGINIASGIYIAFCDDDDIWVKNKLSIQINYLTKYNLDLVSSNMFIFKDQLSNIICVTKNNNVISLTSFILKNQINTSTVILKKSKLVNFNQGIEFLNCGEDYLLWLQLYTNKYTFGFIDEPLVYYRITDSNISHKSWKSSHIIKIIIHFKIFLLNNQPIKLIPVMLWSVHKNIFYFLIKSFYLQFFNFKIKNK
jgi:teichuronic acid biosynthesis glycosyltransferase TuaG